MGGGNGDEWEAAIDACNTPVKANLAPLVVGLIVVGIGVSFGANACYAINPARDLGPRLLAWIEGWKSIAIPGDYGKVNLFMSRSWARRSAARWAPTCMTSRSATC